MAQFQSYRKITQICKTLIQRGNNFCITTLIQPLLQNNIKNDSETSMMQYADSISAPVPVKVL